MHLSLVPPSIDPFDFGALPFQLDIAIPQSVLDAYAADAPSEGTPACLRDFRHVLTGWEELGDDILYSGDSAWLVAFEDFKADQERIGAVPLVTPHYAITKVREAFAAWQASKPGREVFTLEAHAVRHTALGWRAGVVVGMTSKRRCACLCGTGRATHGR